MKYLPLILALLSFHQSFAQNHAKESPLSMRQLMDEFRIHGGNWILSFDKPVLAYAVFEVSSFPDAEEEEITTFISDEPAKEIELFFTNTPWPVVDFPEPNKQNSRRMKIRISNSQETEGIRIIWYYDKFSTQPWIRQEGMLYNTRPEIPENPKLNQEYVLAYFGQNGDPYTVSATISFIEAKSDIGEIRKWELKKFSGE